MCPWGSLTLCLYSKSSVVCTCLRPSTSLATAFWPGLQYQAWAPSCASVHSGSSWLSCNLYTTMALVGTSYWWLVLWHSGSSGWLSSPVAGTVPFGCVKASQQGRGSQASSSLIPQCSVTKVSYIFRDRVLAPGYSAVVTACIILGAMRPSL